MEDRVNELEKSDIGFNGELKLLKQELAQMKEGFGHSRQTAHKAWEDIQKNEGMLMELKATVEGQKKDIEAVDEKAAGAATVAQKADEKFNTIIMGAIITFLGAILLAVVIYMVKGGKF